MASIGWEKTGKRWRVFWHVTLQDGTIDKGSKSFLDRQTADKFKEHCEKRENLLKRTVFVNMVLLTDAVDEWKSFCQSYTEETQRLYISEADRFIAFLPDTVVYISDLTKFHINSFLNNLMSKKLSNKTINNNLCAIKSLCLYIHENYNIPNPADSIKKFTENLTLPPKTSPNQMRGFQSKLV
ncbi:MAG: phage integrase N-terminal SAM-like domain-containing protein [Sedimentisphaerales bacterium]